MDKRSDGQVSQLLHMKGIVAYKKEITQLDQLEPLVFGVNLECAQLPAVHVGGEKDNAVWTQKPQQKDFYLPNGLALLSSSVNKTISRL